MISKNNQKSIWQVRRPVSAPYFCCNNMPEREFSIFHFPYFCVCVFVVVKMQSFRYFLVLLFQLDRHFVSKAQQNKAKQKVEKSEKEQPSNNFLCAKHLEIEIVRRAFWPYFLYIFCDFLLLFLPSF